MQWLPGVLCWLLGMCCPGTLRARYGMLVPQSSLSPSFQWICPALWPCSHSEPPPQLHYVQHGNQLQLFLSNLPTSWMPLVLIQENTRDSPLNCPKDETGQVFFHWLHSERGTFLPSEFKGSLMREGFKSALWKCCSQDRYDSQRPCFFRLWQFLHSE